MVHRVIQERGFCDVSSKNVHLYYLDPIYSA